MGLEKLKDRLHTTVEEASPGLKALLLDAQVTTDIAQSLDSIEKVFLQVQRDVQDQPDREDGWAQVLGLQRIWQQLLRVANEGQADLKVRREEAARTTTQHQ